MEIIEKLNVIKTLFASTENCECDREVNVVCENCYTWEVANEAQTMILKQKARIDELEKVLKPFAIQGKIIDLHKNEEPLPDFWQFKVARSLTAINVGDCRKANDILPQKEEISIRGNFSRLVKINNANDC